MPIEEYLADAGKAKKKLAEEHGRVAIVDKAGDQRLIINSNRATELLLDD